MKELEKILTHYCYILHYLEENGFELTMHDLMTTSQFCQLSEYHGELDEFCEKHNIILGD